MTQGAHTRTYVCTFLHLKLAEGPGVGARVERCWMALPLHLRLLRPKTLLQSAALKFVTSLMI